MVTQAGGGRALPPKEVTREFKGTVVIDNVVVREVVKVVEVPQVKYVVEEKTFEKPIIEEKETIKYIVKTEPTTRYVIKDTPTTRYVVEEVSCEKPIITNVDYERPIVKEVEYEKPVIIKKEYEIAAVKNIDEVKELIGIIKELSSEIVEVKKHLDTLKNYVLVEEVKKVPKIEYETVKVERITWIDVERTREVK